MPAPEPPPPALVRGGMRAARLAAAPLYQPPHAELTQASRLLGLARPRNTPRRRPFLPE